MKIREWFSGGADDEIVAEIRASWGDESIASPSDTQRVREIRRHSTTDMTYPGTMSSLDKRMENTGEISPADMVEIMAHRTFHDDPLKCWAIPAEEKMETASIFERVAESWRDRLESDVDALAFTW